VSAFKLAASLLLAAAAFAGGGASAQRAEWAAGPVAPQQQLADERRIETALGALRPQRRGVVDAYVVVVSLDSDAVFGREAREAGRVLGRRFDAAGRTIVLANDEGRARGDARGSPHHLALALARAAELMDLSEDVLVLYSTGHGIEGDGLTYRDVERGAGLISPSRLADMLGTLGIRNRLVILQACFSGQFVPMLASPTSIVATAAAADRTSFGCRAANDWTLYGDALINHALRQPAPLAESIRAAHRRIAGAEQQAGLQPSNPQLSIGANTAGWLNALEARAPKVASNPVGRPATAADL
jgi:hypothetical protein